MARVATIRRRIFVGCEGASERSYARWLQNLSDERDKSLHFDAHDMGGGDPLSIVKCSVKKLRHQEKMRGKYYRKLVMIDTDSLLNRHNLDKEIRDICIKNDILILGQEFIHEAVLLRHLDGCEKLRPSKEATLPKLKKKWPDYRKPVDGQTLARKLSFDGFCRMLKVEEDFNTALSDIMI